MQYPISFHFSSDLEWGKCGNYSVKKLFKANKEKFALTFPLSSYYDLNSCFFNKML